MGAVLEIIAFEIGKRTYASAVSELKEIVRPRPLTRVPEPSGALEALMNLRGRIIPVLDLRNRLAKASAAEARRNRVLVVEVSGQTLGVLVECAHELLRVPLEFFRSSREEETAEWVTGVAEIAGREILMVDLSQLFEAHARPGSGSQSQHRPPPEFAVRGAGHSSGVRP